MAIYTKEQIEEVAAHLLDQIDDELSVIIPEYIMGAETDDSVDTAYDEIYEAIEKELVRQLTKRETK